MTDRLRRVANDRYQLELAGRAPSSPNRLAALARCADVSTVPSAAEPRLPTTAHHAACVALCDRSVR